jgi:hypothetical protein
LRVKEERNESYAICWRCSELFENEDSLPLSAPAKRFRIERHIKTLSQRIMTTYRFLIAIEHAFPNWPLVEEELMDFICQNILGGWRGKLRWNKKGGGKDNLTRPAQLFYE